jgi:hypothetical protein
MPITVPEILSFEEIQRRYPDQWVLIADVEVDEEMQVIRGEVLAHSGDRDEVYDALSMGKGRSLTLEYLGIPPGDWAVML